MSNELRTKVQEKAEESLRLAKFEPEDLCPERQLLTFTDPLLSDDFRLLEIDKKLLQKLENGEKLVLRGRADDHPVLCTDDSTYQVKEAETSNTLLLLPDGHAETQLPSENVQPFFRDRKVVGMRTRFLELKPLMFRVSRLKELLEERPYFGADSEKQLTGKCYGMQELLEIVQGSEEEIRKALTTMPVCEIEEKFRYLSFEFRSKLLADLVEVCETETNTEMTEKLIVGSALTRYVVEKNEPKSVADWLLANICAKVAPDDNSVSADSYTLSERAVCRVYGEMLLRSAKKFNLEDFMHAWDRCIPVTMQANLRYLDGLGLVDEGIRIKTIEYFPSDDLPDDPQQRFDMLFRKRNRWKQEDLCCYLRDLVRSEHEIGALLTKYCRSSTLNGVKVYNSRDSGYSAV